MCKCIMYRLILISPIAGSVLWACGTGRFCGCCAGVGFKSGPSWRHPCLYVTTCKCLSGYSWPCFVVSVLNVELLTRFVLLSVHSTRSRSAVAVVWTREVRHDILQVSCHSPVKTGQARLGWVFGHRPVALSLSLSLSLSLLALIKP